MSTEVTRDSAPNILIVDDNPANLRLLVFGESSRYGTEAPFHCAQSSSRTLGDLQDSSCGRRGMSSTNCGLDNWNFVECVVA
jgi:hypothetical protein